MRTDKKKSSFALMAAVLALVCAVPAMAVDDLILNVAPGSEIVSPGDTVTATLEVANLSTSINGLQARMQFDASILALVSIIPTDLGLILPEEGWVEVVSSEVAGELTYAVVINGSSTIVDGAVATLTFTVIGEGPSNLSFRPDAPPFYTKLTVATDNSTVLPATTSSVVITSACDDGLYCNGAETFVGGSCQVGVAPDCSSFTTQCSDGVCNELADTCEALPINEGLACDDLDFCTVGDTCTAGVCDSVAVDCSSFDDACNVGVCDPLDGSCYADPTNESGSCDDGLFCTGTDTCNAGVCVSSGDPCTPLLCDEPTDTCLAPVQIDNVEVFYSGRFSDQADPSKWVCATGSTTTLDNITNYMRGITGIRIFFNQEVQFATTPDAAFTFDWTTGTGTSFSAVTDVATNITITPTIVAGVTVVTITLADDHVRKRWLRVTIDSVQVTTNGVELDGELFGNPVTLPSGEGVPGGDAVFVIGNQTGDVDGDRKVLLTDIGLIRSVVNPFPVVPITNVYDVDKDGKVLLSDVGDARLEVNPFFALPLFVP